MVVLKAKDFVTDNEIRQMICTKAFSKKDPNEDTYHSTIPDTEIDIEYVTNIDVKNYISLIQSECKKLSMKLNEARKFAYECNFDKIMATAESMTLVSENIWTITYYSNNK